MSNEKGIITGHFIAHWGVPNEIRPHKVKGIEEFAILEFAPKGSRKTWRYATNGMSSYIQFYPSQQVKVRTELYGCTQKKTPWVDDLLAAIASYPQDYNTYLAEGDTINVAQSIDRNSSWYTGVLVAPPDPSDPPTLGLVGGLSENVLVHQIIGILPSELLFVERFSGKLLWQHLLTIGEPVLLDEKRVEAVLPENPSGHGSGDKAGL